MHIHRREIRKSPNASRKLCARVKNGRTPWLISYVARLHQEVSQKRRFPGFSTSTPARPDPKQPLVRANVVLGGAPSRTFLQKRAWRKMSGTGLRRSAPWRDRHRPGCGSGQPCNNTIDPLRHSVAETSNRGSSSSTTSSRRPYPCRCARRLHEAFRRPTSRAFALVQNDGVDPGRERLFAPCEGVIRGTGMMLTWIRELWRSRSGGAPRDAALQAPYSGTPSKKSTIPVSNEYSAHTTNSPSV